MSQPKDPFLAELLEGLEGLDGLDGLDVGEDAIGRDLERLGEPLAPTVSLRDRLFASTETNHRFDELVDVIGREADLDADAVHDLLLSVDQASSWEPGPVPWISLLHFEGGPSRQQHITGFVRIEPGQVFPEHGHLGPETIVVLQGECRDSFDGKVHGRGALVRTEPDVEHELVVTSDVPFVYLAVVSEGISLGGEAIRYDDPRG